MSASATIKQGEDLGPQIRLLVCAQCRTVDELPDYDGDPNHDTILQVAIDQNHTDNLTQQPHVGNLFRVPVKYWARSDVRKQVMEQLSAGGSKGLAAIDEDAYSNRSTFFEDAMTCWRSKLQPKGACPDYKSDAKRLIPKTAADRKEAGIKTKPGETGPKVWLCQFCPVHTYMSTKAREASGAYDK